MERVKRTERLGVMAQILTSRPNVIHSYSEFCDLFNTAKSTVSEDIGILTASFLDYNKGKIETLPGAAGGVRYRPYYSTENANKVIHTVIEKLTNGSRVLPGGFLYTSDISSDPVITEELGSIIAARYYDNMPDFVLTMETKGIPLAQMVARALGVSLVVARRDSKAYEGSAVKINYISGEDGSHIETMALSRRAVEEGKKALIVDDFAKGGGTLQGMVDMMKEFRGEVVGVEVMIATRNCKERLFSSLNTLMYLEEINKENGTCSITSGL